MVRSLKSNQFAYFPGTSGKTCFNDSNISFSGKKKFDPLKLAAKNCAYCGESLGDDITYEHLLPYSQEKSWNQKRLVFVHENCNNNRQNTPLDKYFKEHPEIISNLQNYLAEFNDDITIIIDKKNKPHIYYGKIYADKADKAALKKKRVYIIDGKAYTRGIAETVEDLTGIKLNYFA